MMLARSKNLSNGEKINLPVKEALLYQKLKSNLLRCQVCQRRCLIADHKTGFCQTRLNQNGKLLALNYGLIQGIQIDPIEKKPFYHFLPGKLVPSVGSYGCNFRCKQCLNYSSSWGDRAELALDKRIQAKKLPTLLPKDLIKKIKETGYRTIAFTYNEPVVWVEYVSEAARLAKKENFYTLFVTNGSWTKETLDLIGPNIDAANIDFKGFSPQTYSRQGAFFGQIPEMASYAQKEHHIFIEITTLLIPGINNDLRELKLMFDWIVQHLGPKTPCHLSQFDPELAPVKEFQKIPFTSVDELLKAKEIGLRAGLKFIYIWAPKDNFSQGDTICPKCKNVCIARHGWQPEILAVTDSGKCSHCGEDLNLKL
jgi:pyruvate formate lyase activating enzyme